MTKKNFIFKSKLVISLQKENWSRSKSILPFDFWIGSLKIFQFCSFYFERIIISRSISKISNYFIKLHHRLMILKDFYSRDPSKFLLAKGFFIISFNYFNLWNLFNYSPINPIIFLDFYDVKDVSSAIYTHGTKWWQFRNIPEKFEKFFSHYLLFLNPEEIWFPT